LNSLKLNVDKEIRNSLEKYRKVRYELWQKLQK